MFQRGLRASLKSGNLLTGALLDVQVHQDAPEYRDERFENVPVFPTVSGGLAQIEGQIAQLLETLNGLPLQDIAEGLDRNLAASEGALREIAATADRLENCSAGRTCSACPAASTTRCPPGRHRRPVRRRRRPPDRRHPAAPGKVLRDVELVLRTLRQQPNALISADPADPVPKAQPRLTVQRFPRRAAAGHQRPARRLRQRRPGQRTQLPAARRRRAHRQRPAALRGWTWPATWTRPAW